MDSKLTVKENIREAITTLNLLITDCNPQYVDKVRAQRALRVAIKALMALDKENLSYK
jgi:hypothetical protein